MHLKHVSENNCKNIFFIKFVQKNLLPKCRKSFLYEKFYIISYIKSHNKKISYKNSEKIIIYKSFRFYTNLNYALRY